MQPSVPVPPPVRHAYVHVPFCRHRCGYCNFTLIAGRDDLIPAYLSALASELNATLAEPVLVDTLFLGGGTPSYLAPSQLAELLQLVNQWLQLGAGGEYSCEMNPLDCTPEKLEILKAAGVNRLSLGGQSFQDVKLAQLERDHGGAELVQSLERCGELFDNVSLDLIFASPGEGLADWQSDVETALAMPITHLSTYGLTIEQGAAFYGRVAKGQLCEVDSDQQLAMYEWAIERLTHAGWEHYEVSNFALPGFRCRHNEAYWLGRPWWAFGPGAASFLPAAGESGNFIRAVNHRSSTTYLRRLQTGLSPVAEREELSPEQILRERVVFGLRRLAGVSLVQLGKEFKCDVRALLEPYLSEYIEQGWLDLNHQQQLKLTPAGLVISDSLWPSLLVP